MERHLKGVANHYRIDILLLLKSKGVLTLDDIADNLNANIKTVSGHTVKLVHSGLLNKKYAGNSVEHSLSPYGKIFVDFLQTFSNS